MPDAIHLLVVSGDSGVAAAARQCLTGTRPPVSVHWLKDAAVALPRVGGGDIDAIVIEPGSTGVSGDEVRDYVDQLRRLHPKLQIMLLGDENGHPPDGAAGAAVLRSSCWSADLKRLLGAGAWRDAGVSGPAPRMTKVIGFLGAKGGAGTTTVALNVACALAESGVAVLAEPGAGTDTLSLHVRTTLSSAGPSPTIHTLSERLWSVDEFPRLRVCLAQDRPPVGEPIVAGSVTAALIALGRMSEYIVLDLGSQINELVSCILPNLDVLGLVLDRDWVSVQCAKRVVSLIETRGLRPRGKIAAVIVNRTALACPLELQEVQAMIGIEAPGVIPPDPDLCCSAQKARVPLIAFEPGSLCAQSLVSLTRSLADRREGLGNERFEIRPL